MTILVLAEHNNIDIKSSTLNTISAASQIDQDIHVLVTGHECEELAKNISKCEKVSKVYLANNEKLKNPIAENIEPIVVSLANNYSHIMAPATTFGKNIFPRIAVKLDIAQVSDVIKIISSDTFMRPIYAGNAIATVKSNQEKNALTIRTTAFDKAAVGSGNAEVQELSMPENSASKASFVKNELTVSDRPELTAADIVISGGRGMQNEENFALLEGVATKLNAAVGASRAAVDSGFAPNDYQVGQTGKSVAPDLYIAVGISGAIQHLAGMKDSKTIVAINKDEEAPIFKVADYGLVADLFEALPELESKL